MDGYLLRYFLAVAELGSFSKAAAQENVTQPTLSVAIGRLEAQLGARLFERTTRRVSLTAEGARFLVHARRIAREYELALQDISGAAPSRRLRVGALATLAGADLERIVALHAVNPQGESLEIIDGTEREIANQLAEGRIDAAITIVRPNLERFGPEPLRQETYLLALAANHRLAGQSQIDGGELIDQPMILRRQCEALSETSRFFTSHNVRPPFAFRTTCDQRAMALIRAGLGATVVPDSFRTEGVALVPLKGFSPTRRLALMFSERGDTPLARAGAFAEATRRVLTAA